MSVLACVRARARRRRGRAVRGASLVPTAVVEPPASAASAPVDSDAGDFDWHRNWYPVAFEADLSDDDLTSPLI